MNKKLLLAMGVALMMYGVSCSTGNDPGVKYTDYQLQQIAEAEEYMKSADFKDPKTVENACILGDVAALKKMKQAGFNELNASRYLLLAAEYGRLECCKYLIEHGADVNSEDNDGWTVLHNAARSGCLDLCKYLIEQGAVVNVKDENLEPDLVVCEEFEENVKPVLHCAAESGSVELCKYLIEQGADVNAKDNDGRTVLHSAAESGSVDLCKYLIGLGLDVNAKDEAGWPVLYYVAESGSVDLCKYLIGLGLDVNAKDEAGWTVLYYAAAIDDVELCKYLVEKGADVNAKDQYGSTALHFAARSGNLDLCKYLIEHGADVSAKGYHDRTVLHCAALSGSVEVYKYLVGQGANVNAKNKFGETVLHFAARSGNLDLCKYLIEHGADVNAKGYHDQTVLHEAAWDGSVELCKYLIGLGLDVNVKNEDGETVLYYAAKSRSLEFCKCLIEHGADVKGMKVSQDWNDEIKEYLVSQGGILEGTEQKQEDQSADREDTVLYVAGISAGGNTYCMEVKKTTEKIPSEQEIETEFETVKGKFGSTYALYVKLRRYQFLLKKKSDAAMQTKAFAVVDEIIRTAPKSQFAEAARYLKGVIQADQLSDQSDKKSISEFKQYLDDFIKENPQGLYRGEALMLLGKISLECEWDAKETEKYYEQALVYFQRACEKQSAVSMYDPLSDTLKRQAEPTQRMVTLDSWCYVEYHEEEPLKLYNTASAPAWYIDDCKKTCVIVLGMFLYDRGKYDEAKKMWGKIIDLDPDIKQLELRSIPNLLMRLQWACDAKKMIITEELRHRMSKKLQLPMLWGEVLMMVGQFDASKALFTKLKLQAKSKNEQIAVLIALGNASNHAMGACTKDEWLKLGEETYLKVYELLKGSNTPEEREALLEYISFLQQMNSTSSLSVPYARIYIEKYPDDVQYPWMLLILLEDALSKKNVKEVKRLYEEICSIKGTEDVQKEITEKKYGYFDMYGYDPETEKFNEK